MSGLFQGKARLPMQPGSWAGGIAGLNEIAAAAWDQQMLVENITASDDALVRAYDSLLADIKSTTGETRPNPMFVQDYSMDDAQRRALARDQFSVLLDAQGKTVEQQRLEFSRWQNDLTAKYPAEAVRNWSQRNPEQDAKALARSSDTRLAQLMDSNPSWAKYVAAFAGGGGASLRDPLVLGTLFVGGGPGAARSIAGRILTVATKEALLNGATTAAAQPFVQEWRRKAGLPNGFDEAAQNVLLAAGLGGVLGGLVAALGEGVAAVARQRQRLAVVEAFALENPELGDTARRALKGDMSAALPLLNEIKAMLPPEVRASIDAMEEAAAREAQRAAELAHLDASRHERLQARAEVAAFNGRVPDLVLNDPVRVNRLVRELAPRPESLSDAGLGAPRDFAATIDELRNPGRAAEQQGKRPVLAWIRGLGGVAPGTRIAEELNALGINARTAPGLFSKAGRQALDNMPATELPDGLRHLLRPEGDTGYVREQDIVDAIDAEWRAGDETTRSAEDQRRWYEENGVDFENMSDAEIRAQMEAIADAERRFLAAEPNDLGLSTDEVAFLPPGATRRAYTADVVSQVLHRLGAGVSDDVVKLAADAHIIGGDSLDEAIEFALSQASGTPRNPPESAFSDMETLAPMADELPFDADEAADGPDWDGLDAEQIGGLRAADMQAEIEQASWAESVINACKVA